MKTKNTLSIKLLLCIGFLSINIDCFAKVSADTLSLPAKVEKTLSKKVIRQENHPTTAYAKKASFQFKVSLPKDL